MNIDNFLEVASDHLANFYLKKYRESIGHTAKIYKSKLKNRIKDIEESKNILVKDYLIESERMWSEILEHGYTCKEELSDHKYPLSINDEGYIHCALCNYAKIKSRTEEFCNECPVKWKDGTCHELHYAWRYSKTDEECKKYASLILEEIKGAL